MTQDYNTQEDPQSQATDSYLLIDAENIAKNLDEDKLTKIGVDAKKGFDSDEASRKEWLENTKEWLKIAKQVRETKNFPWPNASNIKYPLISTAALQFSARAYPTLIPNDGNIVKLKVIGADPDGKKQEKADRISKFMSWQLMYDMERWEEDMDKLLIMLPVCGMMFKKTYYSHEQEKVVSELVYPENFVIDYWSDSLEKAERYSEILYMSERKLKEKQKSGEYLDIDLGSPTAPSDGSKNEAYSEDIMPYMIIQQACWLDLDEDEIKEPYTVIFHYNTGKVLKITPRFLIKDIKTNENGEIVSIKPLNFYTKFGFIPNPDGSFYDLGFGHLLGPLNESVNTLINQLVDAGTLSNLQSGFIGKGLRLSMGNVPIRPGEWRVVNAVSDDLRKQLVPLPVKDPSNVLLQLLGTLITSGEKLASVAEIFVGKMPGQNTPATTTMATIEQGMKVFTAIYKRVYRSLEKELKKIFYLNKETLDYQTYAAVLDKPIDPTDFDTESYDVCPSADPSAASQQERLMKAQALLELMPLGTLDPVEVTIRILQAQDQPNWEKLIPGMAQTGQPQIQQKPDPQAELLKMKAQVEMQKAQMDIAKKQREMEMAQKEAQAKLAMKAQEHQIDLQNKILQAKLDAQIAQQKQVAQAASIRQKMVADEISNRLKIKRETEKSNEKSGSSGKTTQ